MPTYVVKPDRVHDFYVAWSTVVDNVVGVGTRAEMVANHYAAERVDRADEYGTSAIEPRGLFGWDDKQILVANMPTPPHHGWLQRSDLTVFALLMVEGRETEAERFLTPLDEEA